MFAPPIPADSTRSSSARRPHPQPLHDLFRHKVYKPHPGWPSPSARPGAQASHPVPAERPLPGRVPGGRPGPVSAGLVAERASHLPGAAPHRAVPVGSSHPASAGRAVARPVHAAAPPRLADVHLSEVSVTAAAPPWRPDDFQLHLSQLQEASVAAHKAFPLQQAYGWGPELEQRIRDEVRQVFISSLQEAYIDEQLGWTKWLPVVAQVRTGMLYRRMGEHHKATLSFLLAGAELLLTAFDLEAIYSVARTLAAKTAAKAAARATVEAGGKAAGREAAHGRQLAEGSLELGAASFRRLGEEIRSIEDILANPQLLEGKSLAEVQQALSPNERWVHDVMRHSTRAEGWVLREVNARGEEFTGRTLQYHPGTPRHFNGQPYWKLSTGETRKLWFVSK